MLTKNDCLRKFTIIFPPYFWLIIFFLLPFLLVMVISFGEVADNIPPYKLPFSFDQERNAIRVEPYFENYKLIFSDNLYIKAYFDSIRLAVISTIIALLIGYPIAYFIARADARKQSFLLLLITIPFWTAFLIRIYAWITILKNNGLLNQILMGIGLINEPIMFLNTEFAVVLGIVYSYLPFMILPLYSAIEKINPTLIEAAWDLGCKPFKAFLRVTLPLSLPGVITGCMLVFIPAIGEFVIPDLLGGSQVVTIGKVLWNEFFLNRDWPLAAAITLIITAIIIIPVMIGQEVIARKKGS
jgi:putrescine transport system permease protein